jgi:hypothetical protein
MEVLWLVCERCTRYNSMNSFQVWTEFVPIRYYHPISLPHMYLPPSSLHFQMWPGRGPLANASTTGNLEEVKSLPFSIKAHNLSGRDRHDALRIAVENDDLTVVDCLLGNNRRRRNHLLCRSINFVEMESFLCFNLARWLSLLPRKRLQD